MPKAPTIKEVKVDKGVELYHKGKRVGFVKGEGKISRATVLAAKKAAVKHINKQSELNKARNSKNKALGRK